MSTSAKESPKDTAQSCISVSHITLIQAVFWGFSPDILTGHDRDQRRQKSDSI